MSNNIIYNPPVVVNVNVEPELRPAIPLFSGYAIAALTDIPNDHRGPGRELYRDIMQNDQNLFQEMVQILASATEYVLITNSGDPHNQRHVEQAITTVLGTIIDGFYGVVIDRYTRDFEQSGAISQQQYDDRIKVQRALQELVAEMDQFARGGQTQPRGRGGWGAGGGTATGGGWGGNTGGNWGAGNRATVSNDVRKAADQVFTAADGRRGTTTRDTDNFSSGGRVTRQVIKEPDQVIHKPNFWEGRQFLPMMTGSTGYPLTLNPKRPWDWVVARPDGLMIQPASSTTWKLTDKAGYTVRWYDPQKAILMYLKDPEGKVTATALEREIDMNYLDHEQDPELRLMAKEEAMARDGKIQPAFALVDQIRPQPGRPLAELGPIGSDDAIETEVLSVPDTFELINNVRAMYDRNMLRLKVGEDPSQKKAYEFYADVAELIAVVNPNLKLLGEMADQTDFGRLAALLTAALGRDEDREMAESANARMTEAINHALAVNMGLKGWSIDSFHEDIVGCIDLLGKHAGEQSAFVLTDSAVELIGATLAHFTAEEGHDGVYEALGMADAVKEDESLLIWRNRTSITRIPLTSHELGLPAEARLIDQANFPAFYNACESIFNRTPDVPVAFKNRYLALTDGKVYELVAGYYNRGALIVKRADFVVAK